MQLESSHDALEGQDKAIVEIVGIIQAILIGQQGVEGGTDADQAATGLVFAGQAVDLKTKHDADMAQGDFRQQPGEIVAADGAGAGAPLITIKDANAFARPAPAKSHVLEIDLDLGRFAVALNLLGMGLANIDDGPTLQMVRGDFGWPAAGGASGVVIVHLRSAGSGVAEVLKQQQGQLGQQIGLQLRRQLLPARNRLAARWGRGGTVRLGPRDDIGAVPPCRRDVAGTNVPAPREPRLILSHAVRV